MAIFQSHSLVSDAQRVTQSLDALLARFAASGSDGDVVVAKLEGDLERVTETMHRALDSVFAETKRGVLTFI
jgi:hypothetical protein